MPHENWLVEEEITPGPELDVRAVYIKLLEQIIEALKEEYVPDYKADFPATSFDSIDSNLLAGHIFGVPTIIFAYLDTESLKQEDENTDKALMQLYCFRDRREFLKDLANYGDEEYIKEFGLEHYLREDEPPTTL